MSSEVQDRGDSVQAEAEDKAQALDKAAGAEQADERGKAVEAVVEKTPEVEVELEAKERDDRGRFIPKARFDEQVAKERAGRESAERQLEELKSQLRQVDVNADVMKMESEIVTLEKSHAVAMLEGDSDKAAELMSTIRLKERTINIQNSADMSNRAKNEAREDVRMDTAIERLEAAYDALNPQHELFDQDLVDIVLARQMQLINNERMAPSIALTSAAQQIMLKMGSVGKTEEPKGLGAAKAGDRKTAQVAKNVDTAKKQPASMKEAGIDSDKAGIKGDIDVSLMTGEEFAALPDATKFRLRGDMLE